MIQVLWFGTEEDCVDGLEIIDANICRAAVNNGYELNDNGDIIGKNGMGIDQPDAQTTQTWSIPSYADLEEKWWIHDPTIRYPESVLNNVYGYTKGIFNPIDVVEETL